MNIYEVADNLRQLMNYIEADQVDKEMLMDTIEAMNASVEGVLEGLAASVKNENAYLASIKAEQERLKELKESTEKRIERKERTMDDLMKLAGFNEKQLGVHVIKYKKGSEVVEIDEEEVPPPGAMPTLYEEVPAKPASFKLLGKPELKKLIKNGTEIPGVSVVRNPDKLVIK